jgi:peptidoglycan/LPS O-acetylase OafA/YrhL
VRPGTLDSMPSHPGTTSDRAAALSAATPDDRDRYADLLRLYSITMVVLGHWVVALLTTHGSGSLTSSMPIMLSTWVWQVMALFFFVGGFAHAHALRRRPSLGDFVRARLGRLLPPAVVMLGVWAVVAALLNAGGRRTGELGTGLHKITVPLWFLGVYLIIVLAAPPMLRLHRRFGLLPVVGTLVAAAAGVDLLRFEIFTGSAATTVGYANMLFVWLVVHQLGYGYADGTLVSGGRRLAGLLAGGGLTATTLLVFGTGRYPVLMVGLPGNEVSNSSPPTLALLTQGFFLVGTALLLRPAGSAVASRPRAWLSIALGNSVIMTIFCWHLTACYLVAGLLLVTGIGLPSVSTLWWLPVIALWLIACTTACAGLVVVFRRFERSGHRAEVGDRAAGAAVLCAGAGLFWISETGLEQLSWTNPAPATAIALVTLAVLILRGRGTRPASAQPSDTPSSANRAR